MMDDGTRLIWAEGSGGRNPETNFAAAPILPILHSMFESASRAETITAQNTINDKQYYSQSRGPRLPFPSLPKLPATDVFYDPLLTPSLRTPSQTIYPSPILDHQQVSSAGSEHPNYGPCRWELPPKPLFQPSTVPEVCINFLHNRCTRGQDCPRIHKTQDVSIDQTSSSPTFQVENPSINDYQNFTNATSPVAGCGPDFENRNRPISPVLVSTPAWKTEICRKSLRNKCRFGHRCKFIHPYPEYQAFNRKSEPASNSYPSDTTTTTTTTTTSKNVDLAQQNSIISETSSRSRSPLISDECISSFVELDANFDCQSQQDNPFEESAKCCVNLPTSPRHHPRRHQSHRRQRQRASPSILEDSKQVSSSVLLICSGELDTSVFVDSPDVPKYAVKLPLGHIRPDSFRLMENRIVNEQQWDPGTDALQRRDRKQSQMSDTSTDSVSNFFSSASSTVSSPSSTYQESLDATTLNDHEDHTLTSRRICRYWARGYCKQGKTCFFRHCEAEPKTFQPSTDKPPENLTVNISKHSKVKFGPGFEVLEVTTGFESRWILIKNLPSSVTMDAVTEILQPFGQVTELRYAERSCMSVRAQFANFSEAVQAATALNGAWVFDQTITACLTMNNSRSANGALKDTTVLLEWDSPESVGYAGYASHLEAMTAISATNIPVRGSFVTATLHHGLPAIGAFNVCFHGLPPDAVAKDVERFGQPEAVMLERPNYISLDGVVKLIRALLEELGDVTFEMGPPPHMKGTVRAWATFSSPQIAKAAAEYMNGRRQSLIRRCKLRAFHMKTISYTLSQETYLKIASDIDLLRETVWKRFDHGTSLRIKKDFCRDSPVYIKLCGNNLKDLRWLKSETEAILHGETIKQDGKAAWDRFFSQLVGRAYLDDLEHQHPSVTIRTDLYRRLIVVVGSSAHRAAIRDQILRKIAELKRQKVRIIPLAGRIFGFFMSADLLGLQLRLGPENVVLDHLGRTLSIRGNDKAFELAQEAVRRAEADQGKQRQDMVECPVCFHEVSSPITLECGHSWCKACLCGYLTAAIDNKLFPLKCLGNDETCPQLVSITTAQEILPASDFDAVLHASFATYVHSRPDEFHYCPTPDCHQIYRVGPQNTVLQCPSCLIRICPNCRVEYHDGLECADRNSSSEREFQEWTKEHDVKYCPGCRAPIERSEGCNHMTCTRCHTHICWVCMKTFPKGEGIYDHMRRQHGGIGI